MWFRPCKALICLVFGLMACGETKSLRLDYNYLGTANLDLILVVGHSPGRSKLNWSSDISDLPGFGVFNEDQFLEALQGCAAEKEMPGSEDFEVLNPSMADCVAVGEDLGTKLFANEEFLLSEPQEALNPNLNLGSDEYLFVLFFYNAGEQSANPRCVQLRLVKREGDRFQISGGEFRSQIEIDVSQPQLNLDCFEL